MKNNKFLIRIFFVFTTHLIIKMGDYSFSVFEFNTRSILFSLYFISYWLLIWYISAYVNDKIKHLENKRISPYLVFGFHLAFGTSSAFFANYFYRIGDINLFNNADLWKDIPILNPELTISLLVLYMFVFFFNIYLQSIISKKESQINIEKLKQEKNLAKYLNLKSQIEPHFLFNSLSVLSSIIYSDVNLASDFILRLSKILRYVIEKNRLLIVPLKDEIKFINDYFFLIKTRFGDSIVFENNIENKIIDSSSVPPVSLQLLIENAIKHNKFTTQKPLLIKLFTDNNFLIIKNNINIRDDITGSSKQGLENLTKRFSYLSDKAVKVENTEDNFIVYLPIISDKNNESFNI